MVNIFGAEIPIPSFGVGTGNIIWAVIVFIFCLVIAIVIYVVWIMRTFKYKVVVFENLSGQGYVPTFTDKARLLKLGDAGDEILFLKKKKLYRGAYGRKMGKNTFWFAIGQDGYWYNFLLGDLDAKMGLLDIEPIDRDVRYMVTAIRKNIQDRYRKQSFMEKYGVIAMTGVFLLIMLIGIWFLLDKIAEVSTTTAGNIEASRQVQEGTKQIVSSLDNIFNRGSGLVPADSGG